MEINQQFSACAEDYSIIRPSYPQALFSWLSSQLTQQNVAIDCGTGNGQAAVQLCPYFKKVYALDSSHAQLVHSMKHPSITYLNINSENIDTINEPVDLIISACAAHWFDLDVFYAACKKVMHSNSLIAIWSYSWPIAIDKKVNTILDGLKSTLEPHWSAESRMHINGYEDIFFPFPSIKAPQLSIEAEWTILDLVRFLGTWATIIKYEKEVDHNLLRDFHTKLSTELDTTRSYKFTFPLFIRCGKKKN